MFTRWTKHLPKDKQNEFKAQVGAAQPFIKRLIELVNEDMQSSETIMRGRDSYDKDSWPYFQADLLGEQRAYKKILSLLENVKHDN